MSESNIVHLPYGTINQVNMPAVGQLVADAVVGGSPFSGELGKWFYMDDSQVIYNSAVGTVFGGRFRIVQLSPTSAVPVVGQILFWDAIATYADNLYVVTTSETAASTDSAMLRAGICLSTNLTVGNYTVIQDVGVVFVKFRAALSVAGRQGYPVYCAAAGGADLGFADQIGGGGPASMTDAALLDGRFIGNAIDLPTNGGLKRVYVNFASLRG